MQPTPAATATVRAFVRRALELEGGTTPTLTVPLAPPSRGADPLPADDVAAVAFRQRVADVLWMHADALDLPVDLRRVIDRERAPTRRPMLVRLLEMSRIDELLDTAGIRHLFVKGPALSLLTTGDADARGVGDIDLLVAPEDTSRTIATLVDAGWQAVQTLPPEGSWAWSRLLRTGNETPLYGAACAVDLHWRLDPTLDGLPSFAEMWSRRQSVLVGGRELPTPSTADAFGHVLQHAAKDEWCWLRNEVDIHRLCRLPEAWTGFEPTPLHVRALAVTEAHLGLPAGVPAKVRSQVSRLPATTRARLLRRVERAQGRPPRTVAEMPMTAPLAHSRYELRVSRSRRDVGRIASSLVIPAHVLANLGTDSPWTAVPRAYGQRADRLLQRLALRPGPRPLRRSTPDRTGERAR